nr:MAG TPA: hypothetical protein [Caudoviricetes sp.]
MHGRGFRKNLRFCHAQSWKPSSTNAPLTGRTI